MKDRVPMHWRQYLAATAALDHVLIDRSAALLHGVDAYAWAEHDLPLRPETCVLPGRRATKRIAVDGCVRTLAPHDVMTLDGVLVTTPLRTAVDLGRLLRRRDAYAAMNALARGCGFGPFEVCAELPGLKGQRGVRQLRDLAGLIEPRVESPGESRVLLAIADRGLPLPVPQVTVRVGLEEFRLDFAYRRLRIGVEYDGEEFHTSMVDVTRDQRRRELLRDAGWILITLTAADFSGPLDGAWLTRLHDRLSVDTTNRQRKRPTRPVWTANSTIDYGPLGVSVGPTRRQSRVE